MMTVVMIVVAAVTPPFSTILERSRDYIKTDTCRLHGT